VQINHKKLYYSYYTSGKFLTLKFKFQVKSNLDPRDRGWVKSSDTPPPPSMTNSSGGEAGLWSLIQSTFPGPNSNKIRIITQKLPMGKYMKLHSKALSIPYHVFPHSVEQ
jgi:hypothetical protein